MKSLSLPACIDSPGHPEVSRPVNSQRGLVPSHDEPIVFAFDSGCTLYRRLQEATIGSLQASFILYSQRGLNGDMKMLKKNTRITLLLSALIGLVLVSFSTVPQAHASQVSTTSRGLAGYFATVSSGEFTQVTAEWNQPAITCQPSLGEAQIEGEGVGIQDPTSSTVDLLFTGGSCTPLLGYAAAIFASAMPGPIVLSLTVAPGDKFSGTLTFSPSTGAVTAELTDLSTGQSVSSALSQPSTPILFTVAGWFMFPGGTPSGAPNALAEFNTPITFSHCSATVSGNTSSIAGFSNVSRLTLVDGSGSTMATTSHLSRQGSSFKVIWISST